MVVRDPNFSFLFKYLCVQDCRGLVRPSYSCFTDIFFPVRVVVFFIVLVAVVVVGMFSTCLSSVREAALFINDGRPAMGVRFFPKDERDARFSSR